MYEIISRHFMATISNDARFFKKKVVFDINGNEFNLKGTACVDPGFLEVLPWIKIYQNTIPNFKKGDGF